jgi:type II secretory pathway pseudopilin PulG
LIVVAIIALLVSILLPSLSAAREMAQAAACLSNARSIRMAATFYSNDFDGWLGPTTIFYRRLDPVDPPMPPQMVAAGLTYPEITPADFYCAMDYISLGKTRQYIDGNGNTVQVLGNEILTCPVAVNRLSDGLIHRICRANYGNVETHYFFSSLIYQYRNDALAVRRTNNTGPYKQEELADAAKTAFCGDGVVFADAGTWYPGVTYAFAAGFPEASAGERSTCFGAITTWGGSYTEDPPYTHKYGPSAAFWDGHAETVIPPPLSKPTALRPMLTRDGKPTP